MSEPEQKSEQPKDIAPSGKPPSKPRHPKHKKEVTDPNAPPKITRRLKKEIELSLKKVEGITAHIKNVQDNAKVMAKKLIEQGYINMGRELIFLAFKHDVSKLKGIEWEDMAPGTEVTDGTSKLKLRTAVHQHNHTNSHHPEYWDGIHNMPKIAVAEMVCDWKARSEEFGTDLRGWIENSATKRFDFDKNSPVHKLIMSFVDMICEKPFGSV